MAVDKFKFVSPGIFIDEIDESAIPALPERMGPLVIGRMQKGPGNRPVKVNSFKEFVQIFGDPAPGNAKGDVWRTGDMTAPTYAAYAVKAWLRNNSPCTVYRVLGEEASNADTSTAAARAGWITTNTPNATLASAGGAYGLFVFPSASAGTLVTGTLGAIWYLDKGAVILTGSRHTGPVEENTNAEGAAILFESAAGMEFTAKIVNESGVVTKTSKFNFNRDSANFIRKVFNTNPTRTNGDVQSTTVNYWLGETFESNLRASENMKLGVQGSGLSADTDNYRGIVLMLDGTNHTDSTLAWHDRRQNSRAAQTGMFISQDTRGGTTSGFDPKSHTEDLFKFHALDSGEHANRDFKVSIVDIKVPTDNFNNYGTFTVQVRKATDSDPKPVVLEQYSGCNLDPTSANYIGRKIGDRFYTYDSTNKTIIEHGSNDNRSAILRVEVSDLVADGEAAGLIPFGVKGPLVPKTETWSQETETSVFAAGSGSTNCLPEQNASLTAVTVQNPGHKSGRLIWWPNGAAAGAAYGFTGSVDWPTTRLRVSSSEGNLVQPSRAYFGYQSSIVDQQRYDHSNTDMLRGMPAAFDPAGTLDTSINKYSWVFTLDDVKPADASDVHSAWVSGSRHAGTSWTAMSGTNFILTGSGAKITKFTSPMFGGFDGFDITEQDPLRNSKMDGGTSKSNSMFYSLKKAIDVTSDPDFLEYDLATMPGINNTSLTSQLVTACEDRADSLAIIDVPGGYKPPHERNTTETSADALGDVETTVTTLKDMNLNSSYGCAFYPFVKIRDNVANAILYVPPSVVALGTFSSAQRKSAVWFAPAGFTRGGLSEGSAGLPVVGVRQRLTSADRDRLYDANINPIASFPAEGIVIFGQKTLQVTPSALDRINVRRLLIYVKKEISRIASRLLFDQNVQQTWDRFKGQVIPFLEGVQAGLGLTDFRVVLDETTTTPDLVDRNILYAKIFLKPARAIEFIALDFIVTRSGASFDD
mgnify:CR=1 FL=1